MVNINLNVVIINLNMVIEKVSVRGVGIEMIWESGEGKHSGGSGSRAEC